ncbi:MAG TPA: TetR/AcrR family transcriptional regulator [Firmicutes bacterium]|nr:TetR/AcrR family transcriptional regulator [Bacillota bacterium]
MPAKGGNPVPKDTFLNLPKEKQERIIDAAIDEFATHSFHQARVTAIAEQAEIAVGSFYQYFEDKMDLFKYLMEAVVQKKISYINRDTMENKGKYPFFQLLREAFSSGIRFAKENPRLLPIGLMLMKDKALYREIFGEHVDKGIDFFRQMLEEAKAQGEIDPAIDPRLAAHMIAGMTFSLSDFVYADGKVDQDDMAIIDQMLYIVENGLKKK